MSETLFAIYPQPIRQTLLDLYQSAKLQIYGQALIDLNQPLRIKKRGRLIPPGSPEHEQTCLEMLKKDALICSFDKINQSFNPDLTWVCLHSACEQTKANHTHLKYMLCSGSFCSKAEKRGMIKKLACLDQQIKKLQAALLALQKNT